MTKEEFWAKCFFMFLENGERGDHAVILADEFLKEFVKRFPISKEKQEKPDYL